MKSTALLIDTNIILDWLLEREPFVSYANRIMEHCISGRIKGYLALHSILNIFYITRNKFDIEAQIEIGLMLCEKFHIIGITPEMLQRTLKSDSLKDLEDGLQMQCAVEYDLDYIITRDIKGFRNSRISVLLPEDFLTLLPTSTT